MSERDDKTLLAKLREGDDAAFSALVERYQRQMMHVAKHFVRDEEIALEVVQEAWMGALKGLDRFEERSSFKTWLFRILSNRAKTRGVRERRYSSFSSLGNDESDFSPDDFKPSGAWAVPMNPWRAFDAEKSAENAELLAKINELIKELPEQQASVLRLRDIEDWSSQEVCNFLDLSETNQRVLLHRARGRVRKRLQEWIDGE